MRADWAIQLFTLSAACGLLASCTSYVARGNALYQNGRYVEAAAVLEQAEPNLTRSSAPDRVQYATVRGLTLMALGDVRNARRWMGYALDLDRTNPGALAPELRMSLDRGWTELNRQLQAGPVPQSGPTTILAATQAPALVAPPPAVPSVAPQPPGQD